MIVNGHITRPANGSLSIGELARFFGVKEDLGKVCGNSHGHINAWSKKKPVRWNQWNPTTADWWKAGSPGMCGFRFDSTSQDYSQRDAFTEMSSLAAEFVAGRHHPWVYLPPTGGSQSPYRLLDFDGYDQNAQSPGGEVYATQVLEVQGGSTVIPVAFPDNNDGNSITVADFPGFSVDGDDFVPNECYPGVVLVNSNKWVASTLSTKMKNITRGQWYDVPFTKANLVLSLNPITAVRAFMFLSNVSFTDAAFNDEDDTDGVFMSAFGVPYAIVSLHRYGTVAINAFGPAYSDEDLVWRNAYVTCPMVVSVTSGTTATLHNATINIALLSDATAYDNGTIDLTTFRSRYFENSTLPMTLTLNPSTVVNMSIYASTEDGFDPTKAYVCVLEADELTTPVIDWTVIDTNPS